ncbi:MAG: hypothetical protein DME94_10720 [Verrucomicrobia bacterium]|nr:MAG: hypothetical protein DME94_10720 [Verrucomicrobiota bacterium]
MPFRFQCRRKFKRACFAQGCIGRDLSGFLFPALDQLRIAHNVDKSAELRLIIVIIRRAQKRSAQAAARHI